MPFVVAAAFRIKKKYLDEFHRRVRRHAHNCVTREPGCLAFEVSVDKDDPRRFFLYEVYVDEADFEAHKEAAHVTRHLGATETWIDGKVEIVGLMNRLHAPNK